MDYKAIPLNVAEWAKKKGMLDGVLTNFSEKSRQFVEEVARKKAEKWFDTHQLSPEDKEILFASFASINADYFAGYKIDREKYKRGIELMKKQKDSFYISYIQSILSDNSKSQNQLTLNIE